MPPRDRSALSEEEALQAFDDFLAESPALVSALRRELGEDVLDHSPASLVPLWGWFLEREQSRSREPGPLPSWYLPDPPELVAERLSPGTLRDVDAIGRYVAEVFLRNVPGAEWGIARLPERLRYAHQNKPVVKIGDWDVDPVGIVYANAVRVALFGEEPAPDALLLTYEANLG